MLTGHSIKVISLLDVCEESTDHEAMWSMVVDHQCGSQLFSNDSYFRYILPSINGEPLNALEVEMVELCKDVIDDHVIVFEVCW